MPVVGVGRGGVLPAADLPTEDRGDEEDNAGEGGDVDQEGGQDDLLPGLAAGRGVGVHGTGRREFIFLVVMLVVMLVVVLVVMLVVMLVVVLVAVLIIVLVVVLVAVLVFFPVAMLVFLFIVMMFLFVVVVFLFCNVCYG